MSKTAIIIPARYGSSRLEGKPLIESSNRAAPINTIFLSRGKVYLSRINLFSLIVKIDVSITFGITTVSNLFVKELFRLCSANHELTATKCTSELFKKDFSFQDLKLLKKIKPNVSLLNLELKIGTEDAILTSFIVFLISTGISILLPHVIKRYDKNKYKYLITPLYFQKNLYQIKLNCIIEIKLVHIINMIYIFIKKRRSDKNERTSNRRPYDYSYE